MKYYFLAYKDARGDVYVAVHGGWIGHDAVQRKLDEGERVVAIDKAELTCTFPIRSAGTRNSFFIMEDEIDV